MSSYRALWSTTTVLVSALTFVLAGAQLGWWAMVGSAAMLAALGAVLGLCWVEDRSRWRLAGECALWFGVAGVLLVGLPTALGDVALLVVLALGGASPPLVQCGVDLWVEHRQARPRDTRWLGDRDLERRWRRTSEELHDPRTTPALALRLVREREQLLDEMERRDPGKLEVRLVRAGWRGAGSDTEFGVE
ncbi:hypothetical protein [Nocardioides soli]|uniref:Uncharacterized protein n=1 Tax=Nocardioides soli TaxID=1036020 RepID=A0A7W4YYS7_9ACTN|nr:hypothetical protein [Nocardioides soli]MBB3040217.1 hypothetical protein [Nocardioides soli]